MLVAAVPPAIARRSAAIVPLSSDGRAAVPTTSVSTSIGGDYPVFTGDFDGDGRDDVFLYAPGNTVDHVEWATATRGVFTHQFVNVFGSYRPFIGDFNGDGDAGVAVGRNGDAVVASGPILARFLYPDGSLRWGRFLGTTRGLGAAAVTVDAHDNADVVGSTEHYLPGAPEPYAGGGSDAFVTVF